MIGVQHGPIDEQLQEFSNSIGEAFYSGAELAPQKTWINAFKVLSKAINDVAKDKIVTLFFDELPWLCTKRSRLIQAIDFYWNRHWRKDKRIKMIVCGSSASWIINNIIHNKAGLHNRYTRSILLQPFTLNEAAQFFATKNIKLTTQQLVEIYMFCGGVPFYLEQIRRGKSAAQMVDKLCFQQNGMLYNEFDKLFDSLYEDSASYKDIIRAIASKREGVDRTLIDSNRSIDGSGGTLTRKLKNLEDAAFIKSFKPLSHKRQGLYYRIIDEYCYFYLRWIEPVKHTLIAQERNSKYWSSKHNTAEYYSWMGYSFEAICYKHIAEIRKALDINSNASVGTWRYKPRGGDGEKGAQIDLIFNRDDGIVTICEIKYCNASFTIDKDYSENLEHKIHTYKEQTKTKKQIQLVMITANGIQENKYYYLLIDGVVTLGDLLKEV